MGKFGVVNDVLIILKDHSSDNGSDANGNFDLSNKWSVIEYENGQPQAVKITFNTRAGRFLTKTPIIKKRDRIYVEIKEKNGNITKDVFHVRTIKRIRGKGKALSLQVICPHQSENLWKKTISYKRRGKRISGNRAVEIIVHDLNENKASKDPEIEIPTSFDPITKTGNRFDKNTANNYFFDAVKVDSAIQEIKDIEQQPVEGGGSFEPMYFRFISKYNHSTGSDIDKVLVQAFEQGYQNGNGNASASSTIVAGSVTSIIVTDQGSGYITPPTVTITGDGTGATATAVLTSDKVTSITVDTPGIDYTVEPTVIISPSPITGFTNIPKIKLVHPKLGSGNRPNILSLNSDEDPEHGTNLVVIGDKSSGSWLRDWMMYVGAQDVFNSAKQYSVTANYKTGHLVSYLGTIYESISSNTGVIPPSALNWIEREFTKPDIYSQTTTYLKNALVRFQDIAYKSLISSNIGNTPGISSDKWTRVFFIPTVDYSPITKNRVQYWVNALAGAKHAATHNGQTQMIDPNVIIDDKLHPRTYVRFVGKNPDLIPSEHLIDNNIPHGYKALVIEPDYLLVGGTGIEIGEGDWSGNDVNGLPFAGNIVQYLDPDFNGSGIWVVFKGKETSQDQEVFDWEEGLPWVKNPCKGLASYVDGAGVCTIGTRDSNWVIGSYALSEVPLIGKVGFWVDAKQFECAHSVKWDSSNSRIDMSNEKITEIDTSNNSAVFVKSTPTLTQGGTDQNPFYVGFNFWSLWPLTSNNIPFNGTIDAGELVNLPTMDLDNMDQTRKSTSEWFGPLVEEYFPFQAFAGWMKLSINDSILGFLDDLDGDFTIGIWLADIQDNVMVLDFPQSRNSKTLPFQGDLGKLKPYKGVPGVSAFFSAEEPNPTIAFDTTEFIVGGIYTRDSFDTQGRYIGLRSRFQRKNEMKMSIDAWRMIKPLVATNIDESNNKPDVNIETLKIDKSSITSYAQLKNYILGLDKFLNFDDRKFTIEVVNGKDIDFGDSVYFTDPEAINDTDDGINNTVKVVANKITLSLSKTKNGPAGIKKTVQLARRVWPQ